MFVIRNKDNKNLIKSLGGTMAPGQQGDYDESEWEEVEIERDELPEGWVQYVELPIAMGSDIAKAAQLLFDGSDFIMRAALLSLFENFPINKKSLPVISNGNKKIFDAITATSPGDFIKVNLKGVLESPTCNPMSKIDFETLLTVLTALPEEFGELKNKYIKLSEDWVKLVRFIK